MNDEIRQLEQERTRDPFDEDRNRRLVALYAATGWTHEGQTISAWIGTLDALLADCEADLSHPSVDAALRAIPHFSHPTRNAIRALGPLAFEALDPILTIINAQLASNPRYHARYPLGVFIDILGDLGPIAIDPLIELLKRSPHTDLILPALVRIGPSAKRAFPVALQRFWAPEHTSLYINDNGQRAVRLLSLATTDAEIEAVIALLDHWRWSLWWRPVVDALGAKQHLMLPLLMRNIGNPPGQALILAARIDPERMQDAVLNALKSRKRRVKEQVGLPAVLVMPPARIGPEIRKRVAAISRQKLYRAPALCALIEVYCQQDEISLFDAASLLDKHTEILGLHGASELLEPMTYGSDRCLEVLLFCVERSWGKVGLQTFTQSRKTNPSLPIVRSIERITAHIQEHHLHGVAIALLGHLTRHNSDAVRDAAVQGLTRLGLPIPTPTKAPPEAPEAAQDTEDGADLAQLAAQKVLLGKPLGKATRFASEKETKPGFRTSILERPTHPEWRWMGRLEALTVGVPIRAIHVGIGEKPGRTLLKNLRSFPFLVDLSLPGQKMKAADFTAMGTLPDIRVAALAPGDFPLTTLIPNVRSLSLTTERTLNLDLDDLTSLPALEDLDLGVVSGPESLLAPLSRLTTLRSLRWEHWDALASSGPDLRALTDLRSLDLEHCFNLTDRGLTRLLPSGSLEALQLNSSDNLTGEALRVIAQQDNLRTLTLRHCEGLTTGDGSVLARLAKLQRLTLSSSLIEDGAFSQPAALTALNMLDVSRCSRLTGAALEMFAAMPALERLDLSVCDNLPASAFGQLAASHSLRHLSVSECPQFTDDSLEAISALPLVTLDLGLCSGVTTQGLEILRGMPSLRALRLETENIDRGALEAFVAASQTLDTAFTHTIHGDEHTASSGDLIPGLLGDNFGADA